MTVTEIRRAGDPPWATLDVLRDDEPAGHCNVVGWPPPVETEARKLLAIALRDAARPVRRA